MIINTNVASLTARENATNTNMNIKNSLEKLSSGLKINKASDDASGLAIADKLRTQATSIKQGIDNGNSAITLLQIADKSMAEQSNILDTVKAKLIQANTATTSADGVEAIRKDVAKLLEQLDNIAKQTNYNGNALLQDSQSSTNGSLSLSFQIGENSNDTILNESIRSNSIGLGGGSEQLIQTSGASNQNNLVSDGTALFINSNKAKDLDNDGKIATTDIDAITITGQSTASTPTAVNVGIINLSGDQMDTIDGASDLVVKFDNKVSLLIQEKITNAETGFTASDVTYDNNTDQFTLIDGGAFTMKDLGKIGSLQVNADSEASVTLGGEVRNLSIHNTEDIKLNGDKSANPTTNNELKVTSAATSGLTGGQSLASLASIKSGEFNANKAAQFQGVVNNAITVLNGYRADVGSTQNQVESAVRNLMTQETNVKAAESIIRDVDYAAESSNFNKQNIISQAGSYAISQANQVQQNVLRLLQ